MSVTAGKNSENTPQIPEAGSERLFNAEAVITAVTHEMQDRFCDARYTGVFFTQSEARAVGESVLRRLLRR